MALSSIHRSVSAFTAYRCHTLSPYPSRLCLESHPLWYNRDVWTAIMKLLDARSLIRLALVNRHFKALVMDENVWKALCLRELKAEGAADNEFSWKSLYVSSIDGRHFYSFHNSDQHIDWMRIGTFRIDSGRVLVTEKLWELTLYGDTKTDEIDCDFPSHCLVSNVKPGTWIADLHLVRCPVCNVPTCEGTMQTLNARHYELFLLKGFTNEEWHFEELSVHIFASHCNAASSGIFDADRLKTKHTLGLLNLNSWIGNRGDWRPKVKASFYAVAASTNLQANEGIQVRFHAMKAGKDGPVVALRVSHQLI